MAPIVEQMGARLETGLYADDKENGIGFKRGTFADAAALLCIYELVVGCSVGSRACEIAEQAVGTGTK